MIRRVLEHPLRDFARRLFGGEPLTVPELDRAATEIGPTIPASIGEVVPWKHLTGALKLGATEGVAGRALAAGERVVGRAGVERTASLTQKLERSARRVGSYLAIAGITPPPDPQALERTIELVVAQAKANRHRLEVGLPILDFPRLDAFAAMAEGLVGQGQGPDRIAEVRVVDWVPKGKKRRDVAIHAFDRRGFHVLEAAFSKVAPGTLYIDCLRASHGRNCEDLGLDFGGAKVPGRGNPALVGAGLEALLVHAVRHGVHTIATSPGSPMVAMLYLKMGFTAPGSPVPFARRRLEWLLEQLPVVKEAIAGLHLVRKERNVQAQLEAGEAPSYLQRLELDNPEAVRQALSAFQLSRASAPPVPRDVAAQIVAEGGAAPQPNPRAWEKELPEDASNVRVLRAAACRSPSGVR